MTRPARTLDPPLRDNASSGEGRRGPSRRLRSQSVPRRLLAGAVLDDEIDHSGLASRLSQESEIRMREPVGVDPLDRHAYRSRAELLDKDVIVYVSPTTTGNVSVGDQVGNRSSPRRIDCPAMTLDGDIVRTKHQ